uniref:Putative secreted protein n=1 Tax=Anopheles darlingi TaxID=43151 RepID=A0A2M4D4L2_ANODA
MPLNLLLILRPVKAYGYQATLFVLIFLELIRLIGIEREREFLVASNCDVEVLCSSGNTFAADDSFSVLFFIFFLNFAE